MKCVHNMGEQYKHITYTNPRTLKHIFTIMWHRILPNSILSMLLNHIESWKVIKKEASHGFFQDSCHTKLGGQL